MARTFKRRHINHVKHLPKGVYIGPGGYKCPCCFPGPGHKHFEFRSAKRKRDVKLIKEIHSELV